jgi:uncharacterized YccA/Bax inhibitor family protein
MTWNGWDANRAWDQTLHEVQAQIIMPTTSNPVLTHFAGPTHSHARHNVTARALTHPGILHRTAILLAIFTLGTVFMWTRVKPYEFASSAHLRRVVFTVAVVLVVAVILLALTLRYRTLAPVTAPTYALLQGVVIGFLTTMPEGRNSGITSHTVSFTIAMALCLLLAHRLGFLSPSHSLSRKIGVAISGVLIYLLASFALIRLGLHAPLQSVDWLAGILFGLIAAALAGFALVSEFDSALLHAQDTYPKYMEWYAALGLVLTMVWLYVEAIWITRGARSR